LTDADKVDCPHLLAIAAWACFSCRAFVAMAAWFGEHQPTGDVTMHSWLPDGDDDDDDDDARAWLQ